MKKLQLSRFIKSAFLLTIFGMTLVSCGRARPNPNNPDSGDNNNSDNEENSIKINIIICIIINFFNIIIF